MKKNTSSAKTSAHRPLSFRMLLTLSAVAISFAAMLTIGFQFERSASRFLTERDAQLDGKRFSQVVDYVSGRLDLLNSVSEITIDETSIRDAAAEYLPAYSYSSYNRFVTALDETFYNVRVAIPELQGVTFFSPDYSMTTDIKYSVNVDESEFLSHYRFSPSETFCYFPNSAAEEIRAESPFSVLDRYLILFQPLQRSAAGNGSLCFIVEPNYLWSGLADDVQFALIENGEKIIRNTTGLSSEEVLRAAANGGSDACSVSLLSEYGLTLVYRASTFTLRSKLKTLRLVYLGAGLLLLAAAYLLSSLFSRPLVRPLKELEARFGEIRSRDSLKSGIRSRRYTSKEYIFLFLSGIIYSSCILFSLFAFFYFHRAATESLESSLALSFQQAVGKTDETFENIRYNTLYLSYSDTVTEGLSADESSDPASLDTFLKESAQKISLPLDLFLLDSERGLIASTVYSPSGAELTPELPHRKMLYTVLPYKNGNAVIGASQIINLRDYHTEGYLILRIDELYLRQVYDFFPSEEYTVFLHTPDGLVLSGSERDSVGRLLPEPDKNDKVFSAKLSSADLYLTVRYDDSSLIGILLSSTRTTVYLLIALLGILLLINDLLSRYLSQQLQTLADTLACFSLEDSAEFRPRYSVIREIDSVYTAFGEMTDRVRTLLDDNLKAERRERALESEKRQVELQLLQSQINPHFLYNTFEAVNSTISEGDGESAIHTLNILADMLRFTSKNAALTIPLGEELRYAKMYMDIMCMRYPKLLSVYFDFSEESLKYNTAKFILQPILENTILHGFREKGGMGTIRVTGMVAGDRLMIVVRDDGVGLSPDALKELNRVLSGDIPQSSIGLPNIAHRLKLIYGDQAHFSVDSRENGGCAVTIIQPIL